MPHTSTPPMFTAETLANVPNLYRFARNPDIIDIALGVPPDPPPEEAIEAAIAALRGRKNQYGDIYGVLELRRAASEHLARAWGQPVDPERELTVTCGVTGGVFCVLSALLDAGDELVVFDPSFLHHVSTALLLRARVVHVPLLEPDWSIDFDALDAAMGPRTRAVLIANPENPSGKLYSEQDLRRIAESCARWGATLIVDEVYSDFVYRGAYTPSWSLTDTYGNIVSIHGVSKSYAISGWRLGFVVAAAPLTTRLRAFHDASTLGAPAPLQHGALAALQRGDALQRARRAKYLGHLRALTAAFESLGARVLPCSGGVFFCADISGTAQPEDLDFAAALLRRTGVLVAPGRLFFADSARGKRFVRVCFGKSEETVSAVLARMGRARDEGAQPRVSRRAV